MKAGRTIQLDRMCWGVEVSRDEIYITVETELKVTQSALDVHMECTPFVKD